ncbi:MAG: 50S ribosome-binding GTPase, partial [Anaeroplasmataceae bacterium]|nr:50S ribosome-binding GTPase [Anaeroplasmataceae bacterium]
VGVANVGKSSIINALLKRTTSRTADVIATSLIPGTTLNSIRIPYFEDNCALVDTPGLINEKDTLNQLLPISYKSIVPNQELKPVTYQITNQNSICLGGLAILSFTSNAMVSVTVYASKNLYLHRTKTTKVEEILEKQLGKLLTPPTIDELAHIKYTNTSFQIHGKKDIWFAGFGFVQISGDAKVDVKYIKDTEVYLTNAILG